MERLKKLMVIHFFSLIKSGLNEIFGSLNDNWLFTRILITLKLYVVFQEHSLGKFHKKNSFPFTYVKTKQSVK